MKLERQPSNLIDSFAQTETHADTPMMSVDNATSDMVDSGVGSQHKSTSKNPSTAMDEDEDISFADDRLRYKSVSEEEIEEAEAIEPEPEASTSAAADDDDKKDDEAS
jgi:hypothetical protein